MRLFSSMQTAPGSKIASPCWVWAKSITLPPGRTASIAVLISALPPTARITASAPRPSVRPARARPHFRSRRGWALQSESGGNGVALGIKIGGEHARSGAAGERGKHQADGALANDQHRFVGGQIEQLHAFQTVFTGSMKGGLLKGDAVGNSHHASEGDDPFHDANVFRKAAAGRLEASGRANFFVDRALAKVCLRQYPAGARDRGNRAPPR